MSRALAFLCMSLCASPAAGQSIYVGAAAGSNTFLVSRFEAGQLIQPQDGGTTPVFSVRTGIALAERWGAEVEFAHSLEIERSDEVDFLNNSAFLVGVIPVRLPPPRFRVDSEQQRTAINTLAWASYTVTKRVDVVFLAGVSFQRGEVEQRFAVELPQGFPTAVLTVSPGSSRAIIYDVGPIVGIDGRIRFGDHLRLVPGFRLSDAGGGWSVRPTAGIDWAF